MVTDLKTTALILVLLTACFHFFNVSCMLFLYLALTVTLWVS